MTKFIQAPNEIIPGRRKDSTYVFLAGPIQGVHDWQKEDIPEDIGIEGVTFISPRRKEIDPNFNWQEQVDWETLAIRTSDIMLFWIPAEEEHIEGRDYAQTTKIELMENLARGKNIILGIDPSIHTRRYLVHKFETYTGRKVHETLEECIDELKAFLTKETDHTFFTSDTHFGSDRALTLSKRPFSTVEEMDWTMVERWNKVVSPSSRVIHLGDFGNYEMAKYLNGNITVLCGNYERKELEEGNINPFKELEARNINVIDQKVGAIQVKGFEEDPDLELVLGHEPTKVKTYIDTRAKARDPKAKGIFGHIHGRQKIKKFGVDVGVDGNDFTPVSLKTIKFYLEAIDKHYDEDVWVD